MIRNQFVNKKNVQIYIVTQDWHFPRAELLAKRLIQFFHFQKLEIYNGSCFDRESHRHIDHEKHLIETHTGKNSPFSDSFFFFYFD